MSCPNSHGLITSWKPKPLRYLTPLSTKTTKLLFSWKRMAGDQAVSTPDTSTSTISSWPTSGEISVQYCPTADMILDFFTKPLQGTTFHNFHAQIMNIDPDTYQFPDHRSVLEAEDHSTKNPEHATHVKWADIVRSGRNSNKWTQQSILFRFSGYKNIQASTFVV